MVYTAGSQALAALELRVQWNYLIHPGHPKFRKVKIGTPEYFRFDPRLIKK